MTPTSASPTRAPGVLHELWHRRRHDAAGDLGAQGDHGHLEPSRLWGMSRAIRSSTTAPPAPMARCRRSRPCSAPRMRRRWPVWRLGRHTTCWRARATSRVNSRSWTASRSDRGRADHHLAVAEEAQLERFDKIFGFLGFW